MGSARGGQNSQVVGGDGNGLCWMMAAEAAAGEEGEGLGESSLLRRRRLQALGGLTAACGIWGQRGWCVWGESE